MLKHVCLPLACLTLTGIGLTFVGCSEPIDGVGGGAQSEVSTTILPVAGEGGGAAAQTATVEGYGSLTGKVTVSGTVPDLGPLISQSQVKEQDREVCRIELIPNERLVTNGDAVQNVFIFLQRKPAGAKPLADVDSEIVMDHEACTFIPHSLVVGVNQPIRVLNGDPIGHNVHTNPSRSTPFNSQIGSSDRVGITFSYVNAERTPVRVQCDLHTWMLAWHLPLDHPYGAVTDENGQFSIADIPAGTHKFVVWHEGNTIREVEVEIPVDGEATLDLEIPVSDFRIGAAAPAGSKSVMLSLAK